MLPRRFLETEKKIWQLLNNEDYMCIYTFTYNSSLASAVSQTPDAMLPYNS